MVAKANPIKKKEQPKKVPLCTNEDINRMSLGISGYHGPADEKAHDKEKGTNLCCGLGCTIAGYSGTYNIDSLARAFAIRIAAHQKTKWATYVILNLGYGIKTNAYCGAEGSKGVYDLLLAAGWKKLAEMPGAHGPYTSILMGATTASTVEKLEILVKQEAKGEIKTVGDPDPEDWDELNDDDD